MATKILSSDGGGIRGVIPALVLDYIEKTSGRAIADLFDVIAGTSTGGLIALGLTCPDPEGRPKFTAKEVAAIYEDEGDRIFPHEVFGRVRQFFDEKYPDDGLNAVLAEKLGDVRLSEALTQLIVTAYDI